MWLTDGIIKRRPRGSRDWLDYGRRLRAERERRGMTISGLARAIGTLRKSIKRWEKGLHRPTPVFTSRISILLGINPPEQYNWKAEQKQKVIVARARQTKLKLDVIGQIRPLHWTERMELTRIAKGLTQEQAARIIGISRASYRNRVSRCHNCRSKETRARVEAFVGSKIQWS